MIIKHFLRNFEIQTATLFWSCCDFEFDVFIIKMFLSKLLACIIYISAVGTNISLYKLGCCGYK